MVEERRRRGLKESYWAVQPGYAPVGGAASAGAPGPPNPITAQSCMLTPPQVWRTHFLRAAASESAPHSPSVRQI